MPPRPEGRGCRGRPAARSGRRAAGRPVGAGWLATRRGRRRRRSRRPGDCVRPCGARPQPGGRVGKDLAHRVVALAHAGEPGGEGDVCHREVGRLQQDARRLAALRPGECERPRTDLSGDEPVQLARAVGEASRQSLDALAVHDAVADEAHRACHDVGVDVPLRRTGGGVGAAAQAGAEAGLLGGRGRRVEADVLTLGRACRAAGPAVDPRRGDGAEEPSVEAGIPAQRGLVAAVRVLDHGGQRGTRS